MESFGYLFNTKYGRIMLVDDRSGAGYCHPRIFMENKNFETFTDYDLTLNAFYDQSPEQFETWLDGSEVTDKSLQYALNRFSSFYGADTFLAVCALRMDANIDELFDELYSINVTEAEQALVNKNERAAILKSAKEILDYEIDNRNSNIVEDLKSSVDTKSDIRRIFNRYFGFNSDASDDHSALKREFENKDIIPVFPESGSGQSNSAKALGKFINNALDASGRISSGDSDYKTKMLKQRIAGPDNAGSSYPNESGNVEDELRCIEDSIRSAKWVEISHPNVAEGCRCFITDDMPDGHNGIGNICEMPDNTKFYVLDPKHTGKVSLGTAMGANQPVEAVTYLITGKEEIDGIMQDVVFTFHPGEPLRPSMTDIENMPEGTILTKQQALKLDFEHCKFMSPELVADCERKASVLNKYPDYESQFVGKSDSLDSPNY